MGRRPWSRNEDGDDGPEKWIWILFLSGFFTAVLPLGFFVGRGERSKTGKVGFLTKKRSTERPGGGIRNIFILFM
jgi:hypothetical protein